MTIEEFIEARLDEDEAAANEAGGDRWAYDGRSWQERAGEESRGNGEVYRPDSTRETRRRDGSTSFEWAYVTMDSEGLSPAIEKHEGVHIALHDPARVLRQCAALRELFERARPEKECRGHPGPWMPHDDYGPGYCRTPDIADSLRVIAVIWSDHPDYRPEWAVDGGGSNP